MTDAEKLSMDYFVEGVKGEVQPSEAARRHRPAAPTRPQASPPQRCPEPPKRCREAQGGLRLRGPHRRPGLDLGARPGPPVRREGTGRQDRDRLHRERARRPRCRARHPRLRPEGLRADLHHLLRLHGPHRHRRQGVPEDLVRPHLRLQDRPTTSQHRLRPHRAGALPVAAWSPASCHQEQHHRLRGRLPHPRGHSRHQRASPWACARSTPRPRCASSGPTPGSTRGRRRKPPRRCWTEGADVIAQHQDTTEPQKAAAERGAVSIGYDSDMAQFVGDTVLTSPIWNWGPKYVEIVKKVHGRHLQDRVVLRRHG